MKMHSKLRRGLTFRSTTTLLARRRRVRRRIAVAFVLAVSAGLLLAELSAV